LSTNSNATTCGRQSRQQVEVRHELARWIGILEHAELRSLPAIIPPAKIAALALSRPRPDLQLARKVRRRVELELLSRDEGTTSLH
jgi:hypothetical protein